MRKHLAVLASIAMVVALAGCSAGEPEYRKQSEVPTDKPSITASESADPTEDSTTTEQQPSPTATESDAPAEQPTTTPPEPATCAYGDDWSTSPVKNFGNMVSGDINNDDTAGKIYAIDIGQHDCFDRIVIRVDTDQEVGLRAEYVDAVRTPGKGDAVLLQGDADLQILVQAWVADTNGLYSLDVESPSWPVLRQVVQAGSFEGQTTIGIGVDHKAPFKVYYLPADDDTMRIVVDIAHH